MTHRKTAWSFSVIPFHTHTDRCCDRLLPALTRDLRPARPHQGLSFGLNRLHECVYGLPITGEYIFPLTSGLEGPGGLLMAVISRTSSRRTSERRLVSVQPRLHGDNQRAVEQTADKYGCWVLRHRGAGRACVCVCDVCVSMPYPHVH